MSTSAETGQNQPRFNREAADLSLHRRARSGCQDSMRELDMRDTVSAARNRVSTLHDMAAKGDAAAMAELKAFAAGRSSAAKQVAAKPSASAATSAPKPAAKTQTQIDADRAQTAALGRAAEARRAEQAAAAEAQRKADQKKAADAIWDRARTTAGTK